MLCGRSRTQAPDLTNTQGLKITEENVLPLLSHLQVVRQSSLLGLGRIRMKSPAKSCKAPWIWCYRNISLLSLSLFLVITIIIVIVIIIVVIIL